MAAFDVKAMLRMLCNSSSINCMCYVSGCSRNYVAKVNTHLMGCRVGMFVCCCLATDVCIGHFFMIAGRGKVTAKWCSVELRFYIIAILCLPTK